MKIGVIAVGQAGGKILDRFLEYEANNGRDSIVGAVAVNSAKVDLQGLEFVPEENRVLIGQSHVKGNGVGADNELGAKVMREDIQEVDSAMNSFAVSEVDAFVVMAALGGGTGSGGAPVVAEHLAELYREPVYGVGVLPSPDEGGIYSLNAARSFQTFIDQVDNLIMFDNDAWRQSGDSLEGGYRELNTELVTRLSMLFSAGEIENEDMVGESVVDASEVINTLDGGGVSTIGYATADISIEESAGGGLLSRLTGSNNHEEADSSTVINRVTSVIRKAVLGRLTVPASVDSAERALVIVGGPPETLSRKGIEQARSWVEEETGSMEVRGGDYPWREQMVGGLVVLSGVTDVERIKELQAIAVEAQESIEEREESHEAELEELVAEDSEDSELESLF